MRTTNVYMARATMNSVAQQLLLVPDASRVLSRPI